MELDGCRAVVTGGASGLGEGVARMLAAAGGRVAVLDVPGSAGARLASELGNAARFFPVDVTEPEAVGTGISGTAAWLGGIDLTVNCAGISPAARVLDEDGEMFPLADFSRAIDVNLVGLFDVVRRSAREMARNEPNDAGERGLIVNVASISAFEGMVGQAAYTASKGGVAALTLQLARDLAPHAIRVMAVAPGMIDTPMLGALRPAARERLIAHHCFPARLGTPAELAQLIRAFAEIPMLNGEVVRLDAAARLPPR